MLPVVATVILLSCCGLLRNACFRRSVFRICYHVLLMAVACGIVATGWLAFLLHRQDVNTIIQGMESVEAASSVLYRDTSLPLMTAAEINHTVHGKTFYLYEGPNFDFTEVLNCYEREHGISILEHEAEETAQNTGEILIHRQLINHPARTRDQKAASLFVIPVYAFASFRVGICNGKSHNERMLAVALDLRSSIEFMRFGGANHLIVCQSWNCRAALAPLREALDMNVRTLLAIHEPLQFWGGWRCLHKIIMIPYVANTHLRPQECSLPISQRDISFFFVGCSRWKLERRNLQALGRLPSSFVAVNTNCSEFLVDAKSYSEMMQRSKFCMIPRGDTFTSRRFFDAIAAGCIPVVQQEGARSIFPFSWGLDYSKFSIFMPSEVLQNVGTLFDVALKLIALPDDHLEKIQKEIFKVQPSLLYQSYRGNIDSNGNWVRDDWESKIADNMLVEAFMLTQKGQWQCGSGWALKDASHLALGMDMLEQHQQHVTLHLDLENKLLLCSSPETNGGFLQKFAVEMSGGKVAFEQVKFSDRIRWLFQDPAWIKLTLVRHPASWFVASVQHGLDLGGLGEEEAHSKTTAEIEEVLNKLVAKSQTNSLIDGQHLPQSALCGIRATRYDALIHIENVIDEIWGLLQSLKLQAGTANPMEILDKVARESFGMGGHEWLELVRSDLPLSFFTRDTLQELEGLYRGDYLLLGYGMDGG